jgi:hypothetical protein
MGANKTYQQKGDEGRTLGRIRTGNPTLEMLTQRTVLPPEREA